MVSGESYGLVSFLLHGEKAVGERECVFRIEAALGPREVFQALKKVCEHPNQRALDPAFEFDWLARRVALSSNSRDGVDECLRQFLAQIRKARGPDGLFLPGPVEQTEDGRFVQPLGVLLQDPAAFAQLIGQALVEIGITGVHMTEDEDSVRLSVRGGGLLASRMDYRSLVREFPVPPYIRIVEEG